MEFKIINPIVAENAISAIRQIDIDPDKPKVVVIEDAAKFRTKAQNRLYWKWLTIIGGELGYSKTAMHIMYSEEFLQDKIVREEIDGIEKVLYPSTASLSPKRFGEYLRDIEIHAADKGIYLPHPGDSEWLMN